MCFRFRSSSCSHRVDVEVDVDVVVDVVVVAVVDVVAVVMTGSFCNIGERQVRFSILALLKCWVELLPAA